uniref:Uncharacterized protein n=1 Tax=Meloidogyne javanica TaxID=6303 RepID=A0A915MBU0_MELJA
MGNNRSSTSSSSATSSYSQYTHSIPNKNFSDKNTRQFWKTSISARESFENSPQQKEETKTRLRNRSLILFQQPKLNKGGENNNWWPLKRIKNRSIEKKNSYGVPPPPSMLFDEINSREEEEIQSLENRPLIDLTVTKEGQSSIIEQILLEFGGMHANNNKGNEEREREGEREEREEDMLLTIPQEYWEILFQSLLNLTNKEENIYVKAQNGQHLFDVSTSNYSKRSVEAWTLFCIFIVSKIR